MLRTAVPAGGAELQEEAGSSAGWGSSLSTELLHFSTAGHIKPYQGLEKYRSTHGLKFKKIN